MSATTPSPQETQPLTITTISTTLGLQALLNTILSLPTSPPSLYVDLEGHSLGRNGSIALLTLYIFPTATCHLIDIHILGAAAFTTTCTLPAPTSTSLKTILESPAIPKVFFDVRNDADALFSLYGISLSGICDVQVMEYASRHIPGRFVSGLANCIARDLAPRTPVSTPVGQLVAEHQVLKALVPRLFDPALGGSYDVFTVRPLAGEILRYSALDAVLLVHLYRVYDEKLQGGQKGFWRWKVKSVAEGRVREAMGVGYDGESRDKAWGPWVWGDREVEEEKERWERDLKECMMLGVEVKDGEWPAT
ncbi:hypothetical protein K432DRAFT_382405 [Lepidopterella palustris CBS 459.81]|uniref:3'-5' exonuclease domain-containing protein n=1 Tax=Lepidopterella palustris CBS 459.81 TaxID=1314670 RepID=A0A8E2JF94_9PEZI|nr:hypothetical protein K432DRAFT_382405 [Lepidopterella palustris CBS 459.81]